MKSLATTRRGGLAAAVALALSAALASPVAAQDRHEFRGPRIELDARYHHDRYYPAHGLIMERLPVGSVSIGFGPARYYYHAGVWFRPVGPRFEVIAPPVGVVIPVLPSGYVTLSLGGARYFYANGVYYAAGPSGYFVVDPPPGAESALPLTEPAIPGPSSPEPPIGAAREPVVYPRKGQTDAQRDTDQRECKQWADNQPGASNDPSVRERAQDACLEGRGYTVR